MQSTKIYTTWNCKLRIHLSPSQPCSSMPALPPSSFLTQCLRLPRATWSCLPTRQSGIADRQQPMKHSSSIWLGEERGHWCSFLPLVNYKAMIENSLQGGELHFCLDTRWRCSAVCPSTHASSLVLKTDLQSSSYIFTNSSIFNRLYKQTF